MNNRIRIGPPIHKIRKPNRRHYYPQNTLSAIVQIPKDQMARVRQAIVQEPMHTNKKNIRELTLKAAQKGTSHTKK